MIYDVVKYHLPHDDRDVAHDTNNNIHLESVCEDIEGGTQFSVGRNYHSRCHIDHDYALSILSVYNDSSDFNDIIHYFVFPDYDLKVPMRMNDVMVFNPLSYHSCSDPLDDRSYIFSQYTSQKTIFARASCHYNIKNVC